mmetsp:Transcript_37041/g.104510  ORF Transcript_37041/g.104510 Transcript_37041/m.104510 type:complete len:265 (-) Transcript_37041:88-882(-)
MLASMMPSRFVAADHPVSPVTPLVAMVGYAITVVVLKNACATRRDFKMFTIFHNLFLATASAVMACGATIALAERYVEEGHDGIFCSQRPAGTVLDGAPGFWLYLYYWSKYIELIDTLLLCFKLKPTIPLHLYHHTVMLWLSWGSFHFDWLEGSVWCTIVNSVIHTIMYSYYLLTALGYDVWWKKYLTAAQIFQFITGSVYVTIFLFNDHTRAHGGRSGCGTFERRYTAWAGHFINLSFIVVFLQFFRSAYKGKSGCHRAHKKA